MKAEPGFNEEIFERLKSYTIDEDAQEQDTLKKRFTAARREILELRNRLHDLREMKQVVLPENIETKSAVALFREFIEEILNQDNNQELKPAVIRKMADKIGQHVLWTRITSTPIIHELIALGPWWINHVPLEFIEKIRDIGLRYVLNGITIPVQAVRRDLLKAKAVFMGHCVCRSSGLVDDLTTNDKEWTIASEEDNTLMLNRLMQAYQDEKKKDILSDRNTPLVKTFRQLESYNRSSSPKYSLNTFFAGLYPLWEIMPVHEDYTPNWIRSMYLNNKAFPVPKRIAVEIVNSLYYSRGIIFSSMKLFDTRYTICSCPTPENSGGCILTNWYYYDNSNDSLLPGTSFFGQKKDKLGNTENCSQFPHRSKRPCIGCGCDHSRDAQRNILEGLKETDELFGTLPVE